jgi:hypothetical protein
MEIYLKQNQLKYSTVFRHLQHSRWTCAKSYINKQTNKLMNFKYMNKLIYICIDIYTSIYIYIHVYCIHVIHLLHSFNIDQVYNFRKSTDIVFQKDATLPRFHGQNVLRWCPEVVEKTSQPSKSLIEFNRNILDIVTKTLPVDQTNQDLRRITYQQRPAPI